MQEYRISTLLVVNSLKMIFFALTFLKLTFYQMGFFLEPRNIVSFETTKVLLHTPLQPACMYAFQCRVLICRINLLISSFIYFVSFFFVSFFYFKVCSILPALKYFYYLWNDLWNFDEFTKFTKQSSERCSIRKGY